MKCFLYLYLPLKLVCCLKADQYYVEHPQQEQQQARTPTYNRVLTTQLTANKLKTQIEQPYSMLPTTMHGYRFSLFAIKWYS